MYCGYCGCALGAEKKIHFTTTAPTTRKCPEPYAREEVPEACFADLLKGLVFEDQVMDWVMMLCIRASRRETVQTRRDYWLQEEQKLSRTALIGSTIIDLMDLSNLISLNVRRGSGDRHKSV